MVATASAGTFTGMRHFEGGSLRCNQWHVYPCSGFPCCTHNVAYPSPALPPCSPRVKDPHTAAAAADCYLYKARGPAAHLNLGLSSVQRAVLDALTLEQLVAFVKSRGDVHDLPSALLHAATPACLSLHARLGGGAAGAAQAKAAGVADAAHPAAKPAPDAQRGEGSAQLAASDSGHASRKRAAEAAAGSSAKRAASPEAPPTDATDEQLVGWEAEVSMHGRHPCIRKQGIR
jgi:hypothetical protein